MLAIIGPLEVSHFFSVTDFIYLFIYLRISYHESFGKTLYLCFSINYNGLFGDLKFSSRFYLSSFYYPEWFVSEQWILLWFIIFIFCYIYIGFFTFSLFLNYLLCWVILRRHFFLAWLLSTSNTGFSGSIRILCIF